jgi:hypothetical protein
LVHKGYCDFGVELHVGCFFGSTGLNRYGISRKPV